MGDNRLLQRAPRKLEGEASLAAVSFDDIEPLTLGKRLMDKYGQY